PVGSTSRMRETPRAFGSPAQLTSAAALPAVTAANRASQATHLALIPQPTPNALLVLFLGWKLNQNKGLLRAKCAPFGRWGPRRSSLKIRAFNHGDRIDDAGRRKRNPIARRGGRIPLRVPA